MRTVTYEEIQAAMDRIHNMTEIGTRDFMVQMQAEQPYIQIYIAGICERGEFEDDNDPDAFSNLAAIVWNAMREAAGGPLARVKGKHIDRQEAKTMELLKYAGDERETDWPGMIHAWLDGHNQRPLMEFVLDALMSPENPYDVTDEGRGMIFVYLKVIIDSLDNAPLKQRV